MATANVADSEEMEAEQGDYDQVGIPEITLQKLAGDLGNNSQLPTLGLWLDFKRSEVDLFLQTNWAGGVAGTRGTSDMLFTWKQATPRAKQIPTLRKALERANLAQYADEYFPNEDNAMVSSGHNAKKRKMATSSTTLLTTGECSNPSRSTGKEPVCPLTSEEIAAIREDTARHIKINLSQIKTDPLDPETMVDLNHIYTDLSLLKEVAKGQAPKKKSMHGNPFAMYHNMPFPNRQNRQNVEWHPLSQNEFEKMMSDGGKSHFLLVGEAGVGKTTFLAKLADAWTSGNKSADSRLLFHIPLGEAEDAEFLGTVIDKYLSGEKIYGERIDEYVTTNQGKIMLLLDGLDEFVGNISERLSKNALVRIMRGDSCGRCVVVITTRPSVADRILTNDRLRKRFAFVNITGFDGDGVKEYITKFFDHDDVSAQGLIEFLDDDKEREGVLSGMAPYPIYLAMLCHMWQEAPGRSALHDIETVFQLVDAMGQTLKHHYASKQPGSDDEEGESYQIIQQHVNKCFAEVGCIAYECILDNNLVFDENQWASKAESIKIVMDVGIISKEKRVAPRQQREQIKFVSEYRFPHKLLQDYLAAIYLASLHRSDQTSFSCTLEKVVKQTIENLDRLEYLWCFLAAQGGDIGRDTLGVLRESVDNDDFIYRVAFECHDKTVIAPFVNSLVAGGPMELDAERSFNARLYALGTIEKVDVLDIYVIPETKASSYNAGREIFSSETVRSVALRGCGSDRGAFFKGMSETSSSSRIETLFHQGAKLDSNASHHYAAGLLAMPHIRTLILRIMELDDEFYTTITKEGRHSKIEKLYLHDNTATRGPVPSRHFAHGVFSELRDLRELLLVAHLDDSFYETMAHEASTSKIEKMGLYVSRNLGQSASHDFATGLSSMSSLQALFIAFAGKETMRQLCAALTASNTCSMINTLILLGASLTREPLRELLCIKSLQSIRFIYIKTQEEDSASKSNEEASEHRVAGARQLNELSVDDDSLPGLLQLGLNTLCSRANTVQVEFYHDITSDHIQHLQMLPPMDSLHLVSHRSFQQHFFAPYKAVSLKDPTVLPRLLKESWPQLKKLLIMDVGIADSLAEELLTVARNHQSLQHLEIIRCGTTEYLASMCAEINAEGRMTVSVTHRNPWNKDDRINLDWRQLYKWYMDGHEYYFNIIMKDTHRWSCEFV